jgi:hypothetical protein
MQTAGTVSVTTMRPTSGHASVAASGAVMAVQELKSGTSDSTTVRLSGEAIDRYTADQDRVESKNGESENPFRQQQTAEKIAEEADISESGESSDPVGETLERLQELLKLALKRLRAAQQQLALAVAEMRSAGDEAQKMAAMTKVQAAQVMVISAQGEVLQIHTQINKILEEQQKKS